VVTETNQVQAIHLLRFLILISHLDYWILSCDKKVLYIYTQTTSLRREFYYILIMLIYTLLLFSRIHSPKSSL